MLKPDFELPPLSTQDRLHMLSQLPHGLMSYNGRLDGTIVTEAGTLFAPSMINVRPPSDVLMRFGYTRDTQLAGLYFYQQDQVKRLRMPHPFMVLYLEQMRLVKSYVPDCSVGMLGYILGRGEGIMEEMRFEEYAQSEFVSLLEQDIRVKLGNKYHPSQVVMIVLEPTSSQLEIGNPYDRRNFVALGENRDPLPINELRFVPKSLRYAGLAETNPASFFFARNFSQLSGIFRRIFPEGLYG